MHQCVKTRIFGRRSAIMSLPPRFSALPADRTDQHDQEAFTEMELVCQEGDTNIRLRVGEYLREGGWQLVCSDHSTCCTGDETGNLGLLERSFRDSWFLPDH